MTIDNTSSVGSAATRTLSWECNDCRFTGEAMAMAVTLGSKREFLRAVDWRLSANSVDEKQLTVAHGSVRPKNATSSPIFTRRLPALSEFVINV